MSGNRGRKERPYAHSVQARHSMQEFACTLNPKLASLHTQACLSVGYENEEEEVTLPSCSKQPFSAN